METACFYGEYEDVGLVVMRFIFSNGLGDLVYGAWSRKVELEA
jgi:hypothetical protein